MFPYADDTPTRSFPIWIVILIIVNFVVFFESMSGGTVGYVKTIYSYGTIPARFFQPESKTIVIRGEEVGLNRDIRLDESKLAPPLLTLFTAMFLHGGWGHILGNMWFLWIFGDNVEDRLGKLLFPIFYIFSGLCAGIIHVILLRDSSMPAVGASGAIAGVMGAYIYMFPRATVASLMSFGYFIRVVHVPAPIYLGLWFVLQLFGGLVGGEASNVAFWAHVGGFVAGFILAVLLSAMNLVRWFEGDRGMPYYYEPYDIHWR